MNIAINQTLALAGLTVTGEAVVLLVSELLVEVGEVAIDIMEEALVEIMKPYAVELHGRVSCSLLP